MKVVSILLVFFIATSCASEFQGRGIYFQIPKGWNVAENNSTNSSDYKIVLTDSTSAIRMDIVTFPELKVLRNISSIEEHNIPQIILDYYREILNPNKGNNRGSGSNIHSISSTDLDHPDGVGNNMEFGTDIYPKYETGRGGEWIFAWQGKEYGDKFIGVHALFNGNYSATDLSYNHDWYYPAPTTVVELINSIRTDMSGVSGVNERKLEFHSGDPITAI